MVGIIQPMVGTAIMEYGRQYSIDKISIDKINIDIVTPAGVDSNQVTDQPEKPK